MAPRNGPDLMPPACKTFPWTKGAGPIRSEWSLNVVVSIPANRKIETNKWNSCLVAVNSWLAGYMNLAEILQDVAHRSLSSAGGIVKNSSAEMKIQRRMR